MAEESDDAPMLDAPALSGLERCIALRLWYGAGPHLTPPKKCHLRHISASLSVVARVGCPVCFAHACVSMSPRADHHSSPRLPDTDRQKNEFFDSFIVADAKHGPRSLTRMPGSLECLETRTKESKHVCKFLESPTHLEPTVIGGELWIACTGTGVSTGGGAHSPFFLRYGPRSPTRVYKCSSRECLDLCSTDNRP